MTQDSRTQNTLPTAGDGQQQERWDRVADELGRIADEMKQIADDVCGPDDPDDPTDDPTLLDDIDEEEPWDEDTYPLMRWHRAGDGTVDRIDILAAPLSLQDVRSIIRSLERLAEDLAGELKECEPWCSRIHAPSEPCSRVYGYADTEQNPEARIAREATSAGILRLVGPTYHEVAALEGGELKAAVLGFMRAAYDLDGHARDLEARLQAGEAA